MAIQRFNAVGGYSTGITATAVIDSIGNITGVGATFSGLIRANAGISAAGGVTLAGTFSGTTGSFSRLLTASAGISASNITTDYLVVAGGSTFGAAVDHVFGLSNRGLKINAGKGSSEVLSYGNETLSVSAMGGNGTLELFGSSVTLGDDGNNNSTNIITDDSTQTITYSAPSVGHIFYGPITSTNNITAPNIVNSVNGLTGNVNFVAGTNITITPAGNTLTIASSGGGGGGSSVYGVTASLDFTQDINQIEIIIYGLGADYSTSLQYIENNTNIITIGTPGDIYSGVQQSIESFNDPTNGWSARIVLKPPFTGGTNTTAESILAEGIITVYIDITSSGGANVLDFWQNFASQTLIHKEGTYAVKTITGITWPTADMFIECKILGLTSSDHTPEDAILEGVKFEIDNIVPGTGFNIIGHAPEGTYGKYTVKCLGQ